MLRKFGSLAVLLIAPVLAVAQTPAPAPAPGPALAASSPIRLSDLPLPAPHLLREHAEAARVQSEIERMQREQSLMQARIAHEHAQRQMRQAIGESDLPQIVAVLGVQGDGMSGSRALLRNAQGVEVIVAAGDSVGRGFFVHSIAADSVILSKRIAGRGRARIQQHHLQFASVSPEPLSRAALPVMALPVSSASAPASPSLSGVTLR